MHSEEETRLSMESIRVANRLNTLATIFLPFTAVTGLFGMNLRSGFEDSPTWAFWVVLLCGMVLGLGISCWAAQGARARQEAKTHHP